MKRLTIGPLLHSALADILTCCALGEHPNDCLKRIIILLECSHMQAEYPTDPKPETKTERAPFSEVPGVGPRSSARKTGSAGFEMSKTAREVWR